MPLESANFRTIHKYILTRFVLESLWFQNVEHHKIFLCCDRYISNCELSKEGFPDLSPVVKGHKTKGGWNCKKAKRKSPIKPTVCPVNDEEDQNARNANQVEKWKYLETSLPKAFLRSDCYEYEENPKEPTCRSGNWKKHKMSIWVLLIKFLSHETGIYIIKIRVRGCNHWACQMAYSVWSTIDQYHVATNLVE